MPRFHVDIFNCSGTGSPVRVKSYEVEASTELEALMAGERRFFVETPDYPTLRLQVTARAMPEEIFPFKYFDPIVQRWVQAEVRATRQQIAARYERWEITGPGCTPPDIDGSDAST